MQQNGLDRTIANLSKAIRETITNLIKCIVVFALLVVLIAITIIPYVMCIGAIFFWIWRVANFAGLLAGIYGKTTQVPFGYAPAGATIFLFGTLPFVALKKFYRHEGGEAVAVSMGRFLGIAIAAFSAVGVGAWGVGILFGRLDPTSVLVQVLPFLMAFVGLVFSLIPQGGKNGRYEFTA